MILHRGSRKSRRPIYRAARTFVEQLESRQLLTTVHGGDVFEFQDASGAITRVKVTGPASAQFDLIGATFVPDPSNVNGQTPILNQIPGQITTPTGTIIDQLGGIGGADGVEPIQVITGQPESRTDRIGGPLPLQAPSAGINFNLIASNTKGRTYGIDLVQQGNVRTIELASIDYKGNADATVIDTTLATQIVTLTGATNTASITSLIAADFLPSNNNYLYFAAIVRVARLAALNPGTTPTDAPIPFLFRYNFLTNSVESAGEFVSDPANFGASDVAPVVTSFSFTSSDQLVAFVTGREISGFGDTRAIQTTQGLVITNATSPVFSNSDIFAVTLNNAPVTDLHSLEVIPGDDDFVYGINGTGTGSNLLHVRLTNPNPGIAANFGPLVDPDDTRNTRRGAALSDLTWNPNLFNPFLQNDDDPTNDTKKGVLIAEDTATDELVLVDARNRFPNTNLYSIYGTNTTKDTSISIARVPALTVNARPMQPFAGSAGAIRVIDAQTGQTQTVTPAGGTGAVFIGARTGSVPNFTNEDLIPIRRIRKPASASFGSLPPETKYIYSGINIVGDMKNVLIGGTLAGKLVVTGSADLLYAGALLAGDPAGRTIGSDNSDLEGSVFVGGDVRNLVTIESIGSLGNNNTARPSYVTGFNMVVNGRLGQVRTLNSVLGDIGVSNSVVGSNAAQNEIEDRRGGANGSASYFEGLLLGDQPSLGDSGSFNNDTFAAPQYLGTARNTSTGKSQVIVVNGSVNNAANIGDFADYYGVALMAGQTVTVQLQSNLGFVNVGVFDPDGRLIASDRNPGAGRTGLVGQPFQFKADRPGTYRFAIGENIDTNFDGVNAVAFGLTKYTLRVTDVGDIALGGCFATSSIFDYDLNSKGFDVHHGDLGALAATGIFSTNLGNGFSANGRPEGNAYTVLRGNLRSMVAGGIGITGANGGFSDSVNLYVPTGSVGLLRTTTATNVLAVNIETQMIDPETGLPDPQSAIGKDYQLVDAAGAMVSNLSADRAIGTIRGASESALTAPYFIVNADRKGNDGVIDLMDFTGDFGVLGSGGPHIYTGPGGNVRYLHVLGSVFKSSTFGGTTAIPTVFNPGTVAKLTDDSGTSFKVSTTPNIPNPNYDPSVVGSTPFLDAGNLSIITYAVEDQQKSGVIVVNITEDTTATLTPTINHGIIINAGSRGTSGSVEVGEVRLRNPGRAIVETPALDLGAPTLSIPDRHDDTSGETAPTADTPVDLILRGDATVDVWSVIGRNRTDTGASSIDRIDNQTDGEVVNVTATSLGEIFGNTIGLAKSHTGEDSSSAGNAVEGVTIQDDSGTTTNPTTIVLTPFVQQRNLIHISGGATSYLVSARARKGIGNIWVQGIIGSIVADSNGKRDSGGGFEGIDGPIVATPGNSNTTTDGRIQSVDIGRGIAFGGSGNVPLSGLFAGDTIQTITGSGVGFDIRGPIQAASNPGTLANPIDGFSIGTITLKGGSILGTKVQVSDNFNDWRANSGGTAIPDVTDDPDNPTYDIRSIKISGGGGIMGTFILGPDIGPITIDGFGFLNSTLQSLSDNRIFGIDTNGYGIRNALISANSVTQLIARGTGKILNTNAFSPSVLSTEPIDPNTGMPPNALTNLYQFLHTTPSSPKRSAVSGDGIIRNVVVQADRNLDLVSARQISSRTGTTEFDVGNQLGTVNTTDVIDGMNIKAGAIKKITTGADVLRANIGASGPISKVDIGGNFRGAASLTARGPEGTIGTFHTKRALLGSVSAAVGIKSILVGTNFGSSNVTATGNVGLLSVNGSVLDGAFFRTKHTLGDLEVGGDVQEGATIQARAISKQHIGGSVEGDIIIA